MDPTVLRNLVLWDSISNVWSNPPYSNVEKRMSNKLIFDPNKVDPKTEKKGVAFHAPRDKELRRHRKLSHKEGDMVEWIGKDKKNRGAGIVLCECNSKGQQDGDFDAWRQERITVKDEDYTHLKVFWQITLKEEVIHKGFVRKVPDFGIGRVNIAKKSTS